MTEGNPQALGNMSNDQLAELVRDTPAFRAAAACASFAEEAQELRENESVAFDRLVKETHAQQGSSVSKRSTSSEIINTFLDVIEEHAKLAEIPDRGVEEAATEVVREDDR